jgi:hypothetical protein
VPAERREQASVVGARASWNSFFIFIYSRVRGVCVALFGFF